MEKICIICGKTFTTNRSYQLACSKDCSAQHHKYLVRINNKKYNALRKSRKVITPKLKPNKTFPKKSCYSCGKTFKPAFQNEKFCSDTCRLHYFN